jgi:hypothetical protein
MDDAVRVREAAEEALADIEPQRLRETLSRRLADAEMTPGVLTLRSARALAADPELVSVSERAAGVQLIYEGLRLTRRLSHDDPWAEATPPEDRLTPPEEPLTTTDGGPEPASDGGEFASEDRRSAVDDERAGLGDERAGVDAVSSSAIDATGEAIAADLGVLAADVFVARGFYLLARTEAARDAVEVVRRFGRDQTRRRGATDPERLDANLEADVFDLAVVAGSSAVREETPERLRSYVADLADEADGLLPVRALPDAADGVAGFDERVASSVDG